MFYDWDVWRCYRGGVILGLGCRALLPRGTFVGLGCRAWHIGGGGDGRPPPVVCLVVVQHAGWRVTAGVECCVIFVSGWDRSRYLWLIDPVLEYSTDTLQPSTL